MPREKKKLKEKWMHQIGFNDWDYNNIYYHNFNCKNCGRYVPIFIKKGIPIKGLEVKCGNCEFVNLL